MFLPEEDPDYIFDNATTSKVIALAIRNIFPDLPPVAGAVQLHHPHQPVRLTGDAEVRGLHVLRLGPQDV